MSQASGSAASTSNEAARWIGVVIVVATLIAAIWLITKQPTPTNSTVAVAGNSDGDTQPASLTMTAPKTFVDPIPANFDKKIFTLAAPDAFRTTSENSWSIKGGRLFMQVHRDRAKRFVVRYVYPYEDFLPKDRVAMLRTRWIMTETHKLMDELQITPAQWEKLNAILPNTDTEISSEDRQLLMKLFREVISNEQIDGGSSRQIAEEKLCDAVRDMDAKYYEATIARANRIAQEVKAIFSETQYAGLMRRYGTW